MPEQTESGTVIKLADSGTLSDRVCNQLKEDIITGRLVQGAKIKEEELAREHGISRGPLREAIRRLEGMHLVQRIPHAGARVVTLTHKMMGDIYRVREALDALRRTAGPDAEATLLGQRQLGRPFPLAHFLLQVVLTLRLRQVVGRKVIAHPDSPR